MALCGCAHAAAATASNSLMSRGHSRCGLARKLRQCIAPTLDELGYLGWLRDGNRSIRRLVGAPVRSGEWATLLSAGGRACCHHLLLNDRRRIINFTVPGDFLGLRSVLLRVADHSMSWIIRVCVSFSGALDVRR